MTFKLLVFLVLFFSMCKNVCSERMEKSNGEVLECLLDAYQEFFDVPRNQELYVTEVIGWTDSTSIIHIKTISHRRLDGEHWLSVYRGFKVCLLQGYFDQGEVVYFFDRKSLLPNNMQWEKVFLHSIDDTNGLIPTPESFDEIQIVYNRKKKCVEGELLYGEFIEAKIAGDCLCE